MARVSVGSAPCTSFILQVHCCKFTAWHQFEGGTTTNATLHVDLPLQLLCGLASRVFCSRRLIVSRGSCAQEAAHASFLTCRVAIVIGVGAFGEGGAGSRLNSTNDGAHLQDVTAAATARR